jgi:hypothetical protein
LQIDSTSFDVVVSGLVLNFLPEPPLKWSASFDPVAAYVWDYAGKMQLMRCFRDAATALDPAARDLDEGRRFPICLPSSLAKLFVAAGLQHVEVRKIDIATNFRDFYDYWSQFLGGQGMESDMHRVGIEPTTQ